MPKCSSCNQEINTLNCFTKCWMKSLLVVNEEGKVDYIPYEGDEVELECPHCQEVIFTDAPTATNFLEGKEEKED